ncbi:MAG TPA: transglutaminase domain-containing protein, partial [Longimicrobium sp.]
MTAAITRMAAVAILFLAAPRAHAQDAFDYRAADSVALATPAEASSPAVLAARLTAGLATDREKARSIYRWMTHNIEYDADAFFGNRFAIPLQTPQAVLRRRKAVCEGFSLLYVTLARSAGLEAVEVIGFAKAFSGDVNNPVRRQKHAWNAVRVDGRWHALDTSWGAGDIEGRRFVRRFRGFY